MTNLSVELFWKATPGATFYQIEWSQEPGGQVRRVLARLTTTSYTHTLPHTGVFFYWLYAGNAAGFSAPTLIVYEATVSPVTTQAVIATQTVGATQTIATTPTGITTPTATRLPTLTPTPTRTATPVSTPTPPGATPTPSPTNRPGPATTFPTLTPTPEGSNSVIMGLLSQRSFIDVLGDLYIVGEARNETNSNVDHVVVRAMFYNRWGTVIHIISTPALLDVVGPQQLTPFVLRGPARKDWEYYTVRVTAEPTLRRLTAGLAVVEYHTFGIQSGFYHVAGRVRNDGEQAIERVRVVVTLYDPWGTVVNAGYVYTDRVSAGGEATFDCQFTYYELVESIAIQVESG